MSSEVNKKEEVSHTTQPQNSEAVAASPSSPVKSVEKKVLKHDRNYTFVKSLLIIQHVCTQLTACLS